MSLAIVLKSALTFLRHRNPELARSPGLLSPRVALCSPCSRHKKVYSRGQETAGSREKNTHQKKPK